MDRVTKEQRSRNMSAVRGRNNQSTELELLKVLRSSKISGWRRHSKNIPGTPDFVFPKNRMAVFVDGCFWHGCRQHYKLPKSNRKFWANKITRNTQRDREVGRKLRKRGWTVVRIWEHQIKNNSVGALKLVEQL